MCLLTTQYLSSLLLISSETKGWQRNARQSFLTFLGGLRKSSAVLNLILSVQLTARGGSVRGFISAVYLSVEKLKVRESPAVKKKRKFFFSLSRRKTKNINSCSILFYGVWIMTTKGTGHTCCIPHVDNLNTCIRTNLVVFLFCPCCVIHLSLQNI